MRPLLALLACAGLVLGLAACAPDDHTLSPTATAPGTFGPDDDPVNEAIGINCQALVTDQAVYDWGSGNFAIDVDYEPAADSPAAEAVAAGGLACSWLNLTSGERLDVAVAILPADELATTRDAIAATAAATDFGADGYFVVEAGAGRADAFTSDYWLTATSSAFGVAGDAAPIVSAALAALG